jgi:deazaflavin-dependent oxidoreductase (nitroreductase family)
MIMTEVDSAPAIGSREYNTNIIEEFRANQGRVGGLWTDTMLILLHHIGVKSGIERVTPVACSDQGDGSYAVWAANGGSPTHPGWSYNLKANPTITVEVGPETFPVLAQELDAAGRARLWPKLVVQYPSLGEIQAKATRQFPLFLLTRRD